MALVEGFELSASDIDEERAGKLPEGLWTLATRIGEELYMRRSWTLSFPQGPEELVEPFPLTEDGESLFGLIEQLINSDEGFEQLVWDYGQAGGTRRLSRKADYSKPSGWAWKEEQGIIDIDGEPTFYAS